MVLGILEKVKSAPEARSGNCEIHKEKELEEGEVLKNIQGS